MKQFLLRALLPIFMLIPLLSALLFPPQATAVFCRTNSTQRIPAPFVAHAQAPVTTIFPLAGDYACILSDDTYFYTAADGRKGLFLLPKSYFVRLLEYHSDYCKVEYQTDNSAKRLVGYVKTEALTFVEFTPSRPYLYYVFDVSYKIEDTQPTTSSFLTEITVSCIYYGDYLIGSERYCYVLRGDEFGYVPKPEKVLYEENTEYADYLAAQTPAPEPEPEEPTSTSESSTPMQTAILIVICLLVPILAGLVLKPRRAPYDPTDTP